MFLIENHELIFQGTYKDSFKESTFLNIFFNMHKLGINQTYDYMFKR